MNKNNKGFMLVEVIIVSVVVLTAMLGLYKSYSKLYKLYNKKTAYENIDGIYAIKIIIDDLLENNKINDIMNTDVETNIKYIINEKDNQTCTSYVCNKIKSFYNVKNLIIINKDSMQNIDLGSSSLNEYKNYLAKKNNNSNLDESQKYQYFIIIEYLENNKKYYSSTKLR